MCMGGLSLGCHELHAGELYNRPQRAGQAEAKVFLAADQASTPVVEATAVSHTTGGRRNTAGGARAYAASSGSRMRTAVALMWTRALAHGRRVGDAVEPMRMGKIRCRSLFFFFIFWRNCVCR
jgi:hypothetical protein